MINFFFWLNFKNLLFLCPSLSFFSFSASNDCVAIRHNTKMTKKMSSGGTNETTQVPLFRVFEIVCVFFFFCLSNQTQAPKQQFPEQTCPRNNTNKISLNTDKNNNNNNKINHHHHTTIIPTTNKCPPTNPRGKIHKKERGMRKEKEKGEGDEEEEQQKAHQKKL